MHKDNTYVSQWFYAEGNRERRGPIRDEDITQLFQSRRIDEDTLVWREGAGDWRPLRDFAGELGLDLQKPAAASVQSVPPSLPPGLQTVHTSAPSRQGLRARHCSRPRCRPATRRPPQLPAKACPAARSPASSPPWSGWS